jgi:hypothetical protein
MVLRWGAAGQSMPPPIAGNVRGAVVQGTRPHCGGAALPPWAQRVGETPGKDFPLLIRRGSRNTEPRVVAEVKTDANGLFQAKVPPGTYCVVGAGQREVKLKLAKGTDAGTAQCLATENATCLATFEVGPSASPPVPVVVRVPGRCFGSCYHGPLPP